MVNQMQIVVYDKKNNIKIHYDDVISITQEYKSDIVGIRCNDGFRTNIYVGKDTDIEITINFFNLDIESEEIRIEYGGENYEDY